MYLRLNEHAFGLNFEYPVFRFCLNAIAASNPPPIARPRSAVKAARLTIGDYDQSVELAPDATRAVFRTTLQPGPAMLQTWLTRPDGEQHGAYYAKVELVGNIEQGTRTSE